MKKLFFIALIMLFLFGNVFAYVAPTFEGQPIIVESDSSFYGSDQGLVIIDLNVDHLETDVKDLYLNISGLESYEVSLTKIKVNGVLEETSFNSKSKKFKSDKKIKFKANEKKKIQLEISFDPEELGFGREFDIQLVTKDGTIIADLDPFLSGWNYRQEWTLNTNGIGLSASVTGDHTMLFSKTSDDTDFWANVNSDGNDVRFTDSSNNDYNYYFQEFNSTTDSMIAKVLVTETFDSSTDITGYMYYGNDSATSVEDEAHSFNSNIKAYWDFDETSGDLLDHVGSNDGTISNITDEQSGIINDSYSFNGSTSSINLGANGDLDTQGDLTMSLWYYRTSLVNETQALMGLGHDGGTYEQYTIFLTNGNLDYRVRNTGVSLFRVNEPSETINAWVHVVALIDGTTMRAYVDGVLIGSDTITGTRTNVADSFYMGRSESYYSETFLGKLDEASFSTTAISADEVKLIYYDQNNSLISFSSQESSNSAPDLNVTSPILDLNWNGTHAITFDVLDADATNNLDVNLYYSASAGSMTNLIYADSNLADASGITCSDYNFLDSTSCTYSWDTTTASDGQYYIDVNVFDGTAFDEVSSPIFRVDNTDPVTTFSGCTNDWFNVTKTITLSCSDSGSTCNGTTYSLDGGAWQTYSGTFDLTTDLNHQIDYNSIDYATNVETTKTSYCAVDKTSPSVASPIFVGFVIFGGFINGVGTILGGVATDVLSGIDDATCEYTLNGGGSWLSGVWDTDHCEKTSVSITNGTDYNIGTRVDDNAGNTGTSDYNGIYVGDTTAPSTTDDASNDWSSINETIILNCSDGSGSGCLQSYYCVDEAGSCTPSTIGSSVSVECTAENVCSQYVRYFSEDNIDNNESVKQSVLTRIDKELPVATSIVITDTAGRTEDPTPALTIDSTDGSGAGLKEMSFSCNDSTWGSWITYNTSYSAFDITSGAGCLATYGAKTIYVRVRDNVDNVSLSTSDSTLLDAPITFGDLNLFLVGDYTQNADLTINSDHNIEVQVKATSNDLNIQSTKWFYQSPFSDANCSGYIRGDIVCGFQEEDKFDLIDLTSTTFTLRSESEDDHTFIPYAYNTDPDDYAVKSATSVTFNNSDDWAKTLISNVMVDENVFYNMSWFGSFNGVSSRTLNVYDCNSDVADPVGNGNCFVTPFTAGSVVDDDGYYSIKHISSDTNQIGGVNLNVDGNHFIYYNCPSCSVPNYWELGLIDFNSNVDKIRNSISATGVANLVAIEKTIDSHYHFIDIERNSNFTFYFTIDNNQGKTYTSTEYNELISLVNLAPEIDEFTSPTATDYNLNIDVNISVSDPESNTLLCDFNLVNTSLVHVGILAEDISPVNSICHFDFNSLLYSDANYLIRAIVRETTTSELFSNIGFSEEFIINNVVDQAPTITIVQPNGNELYDSASDTPTIIFTLRDTDTNALYVNINYSATTGIGSGTQLLLQEPVLTSSVVVCDSGNFVSDVNCSYSWDISSVTDGNYYINMVVSDLGLDNNDVSDGDFNIYTTPAVISPVEYIERYISPNYTQRDENIYYNPATAYFLTDGEKQNIYLEQLTLILVVILAISGIGVYLLWKRKK